MRDVKNSEIQNSDAGNAPVANNDPSNTPVKEVREVRYLTTVEAARHMRRSVSWLLRQKDIPYYRGKPNLYLRNDLDSWFQTNRHYEPLSMRGMS